MRQRYTLKKPFSDLGHMLFAHCSVTAGPEPLPTVSVQRPAQWAWTAHETEKTTDE